MAASELFEWMQAEERRRALEAIMLSSAVAAGMAGGQALTQWQERLRRIVDDPAS